MNSPVSPEGIEYVLLRTRTHVFHLKRISVLIAPNGEALPPQTRLKRNWLAVKIESLS